MHHISSAVDMRNIILHGKKERKKNASPDKLLFMPITRLLNRQRAILCLHKLHDFIISSPLLIIIAYSMTLYFAGL